MTLQINTNLTTLNTKVDTITSRLNLQDAKINDLNQRVEHLEKQSYAEVVKSPPKPLTPSNNTGTNTNTNANTGTGTNTQNIDNPGNKTNKKLSDTNNTNLKPAEIMDRARNIIGIYPISTEDIERNTSNTKETTLMNTAIEFLSYELGFRREQIIDMDITRVTKTKKPDCKTLYLTLPHKTSVTQIFKRTATVKNNNLRVSNYVVPQFYNRYNALQAHCKVARENNDHLRTKIIYGKEDLVLQEKQQGEKYYTTVELNKYGEIPPMDTSLPWPTLEVEIPMTTPPKGRPN